MTDTPPEHPPVDAELRAQSERPRSVMAFTKMEGAGNDFVVVDNTRLGWTSERLAACVAVLADRHCGVGADGVIAMQPGDDDADLGMEMWNADGSRGATCGNGLRCLAKFAVDIGRVDGPRVRIATDVGVRAAEIEGRTDGGATATVRVAMGSARIGELRRVTLDDAGDWTGREITFIPVDVGNAHAVVMLEDGDVAGRPSAEFVTAPLEHIAAAVAAAGGFPAGVNVELVRLAGSNRVQQRTFERGLGETLACGSGAVAAAAVAFEHGLVVPPRVTMQLAGGELGVLVEGSSYELRGPARTVFHGEITLADSL